MKYIVTGWHRSGTSALMRALEFGGMDCYYVEDDKKINKYGNYEAPYAEQRGADAEASHYKELFNNDEQVTKVFLDKFSHIRNHDGEYRVALIIRNPDEIELSEKRAFGWSFFGKDSPCKEQAHDYAQAVGAATAICTLYQHFQLTLLSFDELLLAPHHTLSRLYEAHWPINIDEAVKAIDVNERHFGSKGTI